MASIYELTSIHAFNGNEEFSSLFISVWVSENNLGKRCSSSRFVNNILNNSLYISFSLGEIENSELGRSSSLRGIRLEEC